MPDSASFYQKLQSDYRSKSQWFTDQLKVESNAVEFAIEKEKLNWKVLVKTVTI